LPVNYTLKTNGGTGVLTIGGRLTFSEASSFPKVLAEIEAVKNLSRLEIGLGDLTFIDSTGMSLFVHIYDVSQKRSLPVSIRGASGPVSAALDRAAFMTLFEFK
jgi:anti-anti-sigma factor